VVFSYAEADHLAALVVKRDPIPNLFVGLRKDAEDLATQLTELGLGLPWGLRDEVVHG
jgi:hypothetical protein